MAFFDVTPYPFQQEILDRLLADRVLHDRYKNLVVAATGTPEKQFISAFDFKQSVSYPNTASFLFVAHREEILKQSQAIFRQILRNQNFGSTSNSNFASVRVMGRMIPRHIDRHSWRQLSLGPQHLFWPDRNAFQSYFHSDALNIQKPCKHGGSFFGKNKPVFAINKASVALPF